MPESEELGQPSIAAERKPSLSQKMWKRLQERSRLYGDDMLIFGFVLIALIIFMIPAMVVTIPAGHLGVLWKRFGGGTVLDHVLPEGTQVIFPWDKIIIYDARLQSVDREFEVLASDGLKLKVDLAWRYRVIPEELGRLHQYAGPNYEETLLAPSVGARARDVIAVYRPEDIYTDHRLEIQNQISESVRYDLQHRFNPSNEDGKSHDWILLEDVLIKRIVLPEGVQEAIVRKNMAKHQVEEYALIVDREREESERKRVEALGIRNFQEIVSTGMTDSYLRWRGIEATLELARSNNAKIVVIGNGKNGGLPLISIDADAPAQQTGTGKPVERRLYDRPDNKSAKEDWMTGTTDDAMTSTGDPTPAKSKEQSGEVKTKKNEGRKTDKSPHTPLIPGRR